MVSCGGIAEKNPFVMQVYADVCNRPMKISRSAQTCALGAAIFGSVVGGAHQDVQTAQKKMTGFKDTIYEPGTDAAAVYADLYLLYKHLHDAFGGAETAVVAEVVGPQTAMARVMKELIDIRDRVRKG